MPLKPEFKQKTLDALRSGDYTQASGRIGEPDDKHLCCIGVAAFSNDYREYAHTFMAAYYLGLDVREAREWVAWNDTRKLDFNQIADLIEQKY